MDGSWMADANCRGLDPGMFFPERGTATTEEMHAIRAVCGACTVTEQCLNWSLHYNEKYGVWGGLSGRQRRELKAVNGAERMVRCVECDQQFFSHPRARLCSEECRQERRGRRAS